MLRADQAAVRHASDGGGRAWIDGSRSAVAGATGRWAIVYEAGPLGIAKGGRILLQVSPFWGWSPPQIEDPDRLGYTTVQAGATGVQLVPEILDQGLLGVRIGGRPLTAGERVRIDYGAGRMGARADTYAEHDSRFWIAVDGDGDGVRKLIEHSPAVDVAAGPPDRLVVSWPTSARPGEIVRLTIAVLDAHANAGIPFSGTIRLRAREGRPILPGTARLQTSDQGRKTIEVVVPAAGIYRVRLDAESGLRAETDPLVVSADAARVFWGDLHGHSGLSDGTGTPEDYFLYARDVAGLDLAALTDHDHWGMEPLAETPKLWDMVQATVRAFHAPGRFVSILGYEWTSWLHGHRHVLFFGDRGTVLDALDPRYETPAGLWAGLPREPPAMTIAHHSAGGPIAINWNYRPDPALETVTEVASVHGSSEASDAPRLIYNLASGNTVRDALDRGYPLGFVGGGDGHDGHPGLSALNAPSGGLTAILAQELTRDGVLEALRARRVYATNGPRIPLTVTLNAQPMGSQISATASPATLRISVAAPTPLARVDIVRSGRVAESVPGQDRFSLDLERRLSDLRRGEYIYVRVVQNDQGAAWSSPFFIH